MDNNFEFSIGAVHQIPTPEELPHTRTVHSAKAPHGAGSSAYQYGLVNDVRPCPKCLEDVREF
jgi:hypothetical protein